MTAGLPQKQTTAQKISGGMAASRPFGLVCQAQPMERALHGFNTTDGDLMLTSRRKVSNHHWRAGAAVLLAVFAAPARGAQPRPAQPARLFENTRGI
jgi:hypothetical protein